MKQIFTILLFVVLLCITFNNSHAQYTTWDRTTYTDTLSFKNGAVISPYSNLVYQSGYIVSIRYDDPTGNYIEELGAALGYDDNPLPTTGAVSAYSVLCQFDGIENYLDSAVAIDQAWLELTVMNGAGVNTIDNTSVVLLGVNRLFKPFIKDQATWNERQTGVSWGAAGANDYTGTWSNVFGGTGAYTIYTNWNQLDDDWNARFRYNGTDATGEEQSAGTDTLLASAMTAPLDRLLFSESYAQIHPFKTNSAAAAAERLRIRIDVKPIIDGWALKGWENYGFILRVEKITGTIGYFQVATHNSTLSSGKAKPKLVVIYQKALPSSGSGGGGGGAQGAGSQGYK